MNRREYYKRVAEVLCPARLQTKKVVVVGLGSGGSRVALELARTGVRLILVERPGELLLEHNIVRHVLGYSSLRKSKLAEMPSQIRNLNPSARVTTWGLDVVEQERTLATRLRRARPDLIAVCTDSEASKHAVNALATSMGIPQVGAGVYDGGVGGEVYIARPGQACYGCIAGQLQLDHSTGAERRAIDYNTLDQRELTSTCALNLDIEQIALLHARFILNLLLDGKPDLIGIPPEINLCVFANRMVPGTFDRPLRAEFYSIPKSVDCLCCGPKALNTDAEANQILTTLGTRKRPSRPRARL